MNVLILSASTGAGHMRASNALKSYIAKTEKDINVEVVDVFKYINPLLNKTVCKGYLYLATKTPRFYGKIYASTNKDSKIPSKLTKPIVLFNRKLMRLINYFKPNVIVTTHPFVTEMVSRLKNQEKINIPLVCIMTDYAPHKTWIHKHVDAYIVANDDMPSEMIKLGVPKEIIHSFGIPIDEVFFNQKDKKDLRKNLKLNEELPTILIMAGSFGVKNILDIYNDIIKIPTEFQIIVITGRNEKLYSAFKEILPNSSKPTELIFFTHEVDKYMHSSDIIITKPGGLTISEALACNIPMVLFDAIPGQEQENAQFLVNHNMAILLEKDKDCSYVMQNLLDDKARLEFMQNSCKVFDKSESCKNILNLIKKLCKTS